MTEEEAKTKWRPFVKVSGGRFSAEIEQRCIGSQCMAWRMGSISAVRHKKTGVLRIVQAGGMFNPADETHEMVGDQTSGHCGLVRE